ncbi:hypothetical protein JBO39_23940 [Serratia marcescens]|uniref:hypothetical protein n=1 Tax=Serratia marcescens TaxID=615 RepID=UPI00192B4DC7|nr:hypothetical protein [Serratia marcescens]MBL5824256.1 hypothetical protein [Serratia marcescens]
MKTSKTFKIDESTMNKIKTLSATQNLPQGDVIDRAIALLTTQIELQRENNKEMITIVPKSLPIPSEKLASVKEGGYIILELKFGEMTFSLHSLLKVESCNGVFGEASFIDVREGEKHKTFNSFEEYEGKIVKFSLSDIWDYTDKL